ncbi:MAG: hypothetical protein QNJ51_16970 [Calothrix sp. MO_167.B12]|nr:hypothetical protein [Calothrix sp. MO_167.B12]
MPYNQEQNWLFIHIPKTAGGSIEKALGVYSELNQNDKDIYKSLRGVSQKFKRKTKQFLFPSRNDKNN